MYVFLPILALIVLVIRVFVYIYNRIVALKNWVEYFWSQIEVHLKRSPVLILNLVGTVQGYLEHKRDTLQSVIEECQQAGGHRHGRSL